MENLPIIVRPDFRTALLGGLFIGFGASLMVCLIIPLAWFIYAPSVTSEVAFQKLPLGRLLGGLLIAPLLLALLCLYCPRRSWTFRPDGIAIRCWPINYFVSWSDIKSIEVNRLCLTIRLSRWSGAKIFPVNGLAFWDLIPPDKRRKGGLFQNSLNRP